MKPFYGSCRRNPSRAWHLGFFTTIAAVPFATIHAAAEEKSPTASPQMPAERRVAPAVSPAPPAAVADVVNREKPAATVIVYTVDEALAKIREDGFDEPAARGLLEMRVKVAISPALSGFVPPPAAAPSVDPQRILWLKGRMVVQTTDAGHRQVRDTLEALRKFGAAEIALEVRFVSLDEKELKEMFADGTTSPAEAPESFGADTTNVQPDGFDRPLASHEGTQVAREQYLVERDSPLRYRVMDKAEGEKWLARCQGDARSNVLQVPRVHVFNGQTASVMDTSQTPFVVGVKKVKQMHEPQIRVVSEGTTLQVRPVADRCGAVHLDFAATFSKIRKVETMTFGDASSDEVKIQVPEVATLRLEGGVALKSGQWLLLAGSKAENPAIEAEPASSSWNGWPLIGGRYFKARPVKELVLMLRAEKLPQPLPGTSQTENRDQVLLFPRSFDAGEQLGKRQFEAGQNFTSEE